MNRLIQLVYGEAWSIKPKQDAVGQTIGLGEPNKMGEGDQIETFG